MDWVDLALLIVIVALVLSAGLSAWFSAPNNDDSMAYHLPRQIYWMQNQSISFYPTYFIIQNVMPPFAEFVGLHLMILSGGDHWSNLVQWFSLIMILPIVSSIARDLGAGRKGQLLAVLLTVSMPPVYLFASDTKNDLVLALWVCILAWWAIKIIVDRKAGLFDSVLIGFTLGLALLTKGTSIAFAAIPCLIIGFGIIRSTRRFVARGLIISACCALVIAGYGIRYSQSVRFPQRKMEVRQELFTPTAVVSNVMRNLTLHLGLPSEGYNAFVKRLVDDAHSWIGIDPQDVRTTYKNTAYEVRYEPHNEDAAPAGAHILLILLMLISAGMIRRWISWRIFLLYLCIPVGGFFLFCLLLKWTPWHSRLHIPLLCLFMPPLATVLTETPLRYCLPPALAGVAIAFYPTLIDNPRPLVGESSVFRTDRVSQMFHSRPSLKKGVVDTADYVAEIQPATVGMYFGHREWEYPLQRLILDRMKDIPSFSSFDARQRGKWSDMGEPPELVISAAYHEFTLQDKLTGTGYDMVAHFEPYSIYARCDLAKNIGLRGQLPKFIGWDTADGLGPTEGPYPEWGLPVIRWGLGPATDLEFIGDGGPFVLHMVCGSYHLSHQEVSIILNGRLIGRHVFDRSFEFQIFRLPIDTADGDNKLVLEYQKQDNSDPAHPLALLFQSLRLAPEKYTGMLPEQGSGAVRVFEPRKQ